MATQTLLRATVEPVMRDGKFVKTTWAQARTMGFELPSLVSLGKLVDDKHRATLKPDDLRAITELLLTSHIMARELLTTSPVGGFSRCRLSFSEPAPIDIQPDQIPDAALGKPKVALFLDLGSNTHPLLPVLDLPLATPYCGRVNSETGLPVVVENLSDVPLSERRWVYFSPRSWDSRAWPLADIYVLCYHAWSTIYPNWPSNSEGISRIRRDIVTLDEKGGWMADLHRDVGPDQIRALARGEIPEVLRAVFEDIDPLQRAAIIVQARCELQAA